MTSLFLGLRRSAWLLGAVFGVIIYLILPSHVVVLNDDFGYIRSVIETLQRGRPWTDDWLEPWAASLSVMSALLFKATGSFHAATYGLQAVCAAAGFAGIYALFRFREFSKKASSIIALLVLLCPTILWKQLEYTSVALYLPCLFWAIWSAEKKRWGLFFVVWFLAFASRQSAITWLVLPAWELFKSLKARDGELTASRILRPAVVLGAAFGAYVLLSWGMNKTHSQAMITDQLFSRLEPTFFLKQFLIGLVAWFGFIGIGGFLGGLVNKSVSFNSPAWRQGYILLGGVAAISLMKGRSIVQLEHESYEGISGGLYIWILWAAALTGWLRSVTIRPDLAFAALASLLLVCLRRDVWDYYYMDVALFALLGGTPNIGSSSKEEAVAPWPKLAVASVVTALMVLSVIFVFKLKMSIDRSAAQAVLAEKALRRGELDVTQLDSSRWGFIGWHLHPYFVTHDGRSDADIGGFTHYLRPGVAETRFSRIRFWKDSRSLRPVEADETFKIVDSAVFPVGWFWYQRCSLLRHFNRPSVASRFVLDRSQYRFQPYPLSNAEWRELAAGSGSR